MNVTDVRVLRALDHGDSYVEPRFLLVETNVNARGNSVTSIDFVTTDAGKRETWSVRSLAHAVSVGHLGAREWAVVYAAANDVPIVYEQDLSE